MDKIMIFRRIRAGFRNIVREFRDSDYKLMAATDTFRTIKAASAGIYREKGSKFISGAWPVSGESEIKIILEDTRKIHHEARHHSYAYILGEKADSWRANDDGEPPGTAGKPILGRIKSHGLTNTLVVVSRYFGGTLLGVSGLINAYKTSAESALSNAVIFDKFILRGLKLKFPYTVMNEVMRIIKEEDIEQVTHSFDLDCMILLNIRASAYEKAMKRFARIENLEMIPG